MAFTDFQKKLMILLLIIFPLMIISTWLLSFLINDSLDWKILLILNPNEYIPFLDELAILITDYSMIYIGLLGLSYSIGFSIIKKDITRKKKVSKTLFIIGLILGFIAASAYFWAGYHLNIIFIALALMIVTGFWLISRSYNYLPEERQHQLDQLIIIMFWAWAFTGLTGDVIIKGWIKRIRPLAHNDPTYAFYNQYLQIRQFPDEIVRGHYSYFSGHSSTFFALMTPLILFTMTAKESPIL